MQWSEKRKKQKDKKRRTLIDMGEAKVNRSNTEGGANKNNAVYRERTAVGSQRRKKGYEGGKACRIQWGSSKTGIKRKTATKPKLAQPLSSTNEKKNSRNQGHPAKRKGTDSNLD